MSGNEIARIPCGPVTFTDLPTEGILDAACRTGAPGRVLASLNPHGLHVALDDPRYAALLNRCALCFCDGFGILLFCRLLGFGRPRNRNTPTDFLMALLDRLAAEGKTAYFVGDTAEVVGAFVAQLRERHPGLVAGYRDGFFAFGGPEEEALLADIARVRPHAVFVGMGNPRQEIWADRHAANLPAEAWIMIGASMGFLAGLRRRGPKWATDHALEWFFRLLYQPGMVWRRYVVEMPLVFFRLARGRLCKAA